MTGSRLLVGATAICPLVFPDAHDCLYSERNRQVGPIDYAPGSEAPEAGTYEQLDVFRLPTGITEHVIRGERLPLAPQGYTWRKMANDEATSGHSRANVVRALPPGR
jgi:hypothetical protein